VNRAVERPRISSFAVASVFLAVAFAFLVVAYAFLVVIPEGDLLLSLPLRLPLSFIVIPHRLEGTPPPLPLFHTKNIVISTEAVHSLIVNRAAERSRISPSPSLAPQPEPGHLDRSGNLSSPHS